MDALTPPGGWLFTAVLIFAFIIFARFRPLRDLGLLNKLKLLLLTEIVVVLIPNLILFLNETVALPRIPFILLHQTVIGVILFYLLKDLMFFKQTRYTRTMFLLLAASLVAMMVVGLYRETGDIPIYPGWMVPFIIMVGASLENHWIHFLNRGQKAGIMLGAAIMTAALIYGRTFRDVPDFQGPVGVTGHIFYHWLWFFILIYTSIAAATLLLHLPGAGIVDRQRKQIDSLQTLSSMVGLEQSQTRLLDQIVTQVCDAANIDRAWIFWRSDPSLAFNVGAAHNLSQPQERQLRGAIRNHPQGINIRETHWLNDLEKENPFADLVPSDLEQGSMLVIPLISPKIGLLGVLMAYRDYPFAFDNRERDLVTALSSHGVIALENQRFFEQALENQRMEQELSLAKSIQQGLLPSHLPQLNGLEISAVNVPCYAVGGDYYDAIPFAGETLGVAIGDVVGKGVPAAMLMANLQASFRLLAGEQGTPAELMKKLNTIIYGNTTRDKFITFFYCMVDPGGSRLRYCNAGHNYPILIRCGGQPEPLKTGGVILGAVSEFDYQEADIPFAAGDYCILFTDGVSEARSPEDQEFLEERIQEIAQRHGDLSAAALSDKILQAVQSHIAEGEPQDDITLVILRRTA